MTSVSLQLSSNNQTSPNDVKRFVVPLILTFLMILATSAFAQPEPQPDWAWGDNFGGESVHSNLVDLDTDELGNSVALIKMVGWYKVDGSWYTSEASWDPMLIKYDSSGVVMWAKVLRGHHQEVPTALAIDNNGDIVLVGTFDRSWNLEGNNRGSHNGSRNAFAVKVNGNTGALVWFQSMYGHSNGFATATDVTVDSANNVYLHGVFTRDFHIGSGTTPDYRSSKYYNHYFASFSSRGGLRWWSVVENGRTFDSAFMTVGGNDELYVGRNIEGSWPRAFIGRMNPNNGGFMWQHEMHASRGISLADVAADNNGNVHLFGKHSGGVNLAGTTIGGSGTYYAQIRSDGSVERLQVPVWQKGRKMRIDQEDNLHVLGTFDGASFNLGGFQMSGNPHGSQMFVAKINPAHQVVWAREGGAPGAPQGGLGLGLDPSGNVYVGSDQSGNSYFGNIELTKDWRYTSLVAKLASGSLEDPTHEIDASAGEHGTISPSGIVTVDEGEDQAFIITPNYGYHVLDVEVDGDTVGAVTGYTFENVVDSHTIEASFEINSYTIAVTSEGNGSVSPVGNVSVTHGSDQDFTISPDQYYLINKVYIDGVEVAVTNAVSFEDVTSGHTLHIVFGQDIAGATDQLKDAIDALPSGVWPNKNRAKALKNQIDDAMSKYNQGDLQGAIDMLSNPIMKRTDGCANAGTVDNTDWIEDCSSQAIIMPLVQNLIDLISAEL